MIKGIIIGMLLYSLLITIVTIYKDFSHDYEVVTLDVIMAGIPMWIFLIFLIFTPERTYNLIKSRKKRKPKNSKYISKVVKKIINVYKKNNGYWQNVYFDIERNRSYNREYYDGWFELMIKDKRYKRLNYKFKWLMVFQNKETLEELKKHLSIVNKDELDGNFYNKIPKSITLYKIKGDEVNV